MSANTKIGGLSTEKWFIYQMKSIQPHIKPLWLNFTASSKAVSILTTHEQVLIYIEMLVKLFAGVSNEVVNKKRGRVSEFSRFLSVLRKDDDVSLDFMKLLCMYFCLNTSATVDLISERNGVDLTLNLITSSLFKTPEPMLNEGESVEVDGEDKEQDELNAETVGFNSNNERYIGENIDVAACLLEEIHSRCAAEKLCSSDFELLVTFTNRFLSTALLSLFQGFANRKKLYMLVCARMLPSAMTVLSDCASSSHSESLTLTKRFLSTLLENGLLDDKHVDDICTMRLCSVVGAPSAVGAKKALAKKQKNAGSKASTTDSAVTSLGDSGNSKSSSSNSSFYEVLFQAMSQVCTSAVTLTEGTTGHRATALSWNQKAAAVAEIIHVFAVRSVQRAVEQKAATYLYQPKSADAASSTSALSLDAVHSRKHLLRVLHFVFVVLEALQQSMGAKSQIVTGKRGHERDEDMVLGWATVRNGILSALNSVLDGLALPNHDTLAEYVHRLRLIGVEAQSTLCSMSAELQRLAAAEGTAATDEETQSRMLGLYLGSALEVDCYRVLASIDHTTVVDANLEAAVSVLTQEVFVVPDGNEQQPFGKAGKRRKQDAALSPSVACRYVSWLHDLHRNYGVSTSQLYQLLIAASQDAAAGSRPGDSLAVDASRHDALSIECVGRYSADIDSALNALLPAVLAALCPDRSISDTELHFHKALLRLFHSKYILWRLYLSVHTQLRTMDELVAAALSSPAATNDAKLLVLDEILGAAEMQTLLGTAFSLVPSGQVVKLWSTLANSPHSGESVVSGHLFQAFVRGQQHSVRSTAQLLGSSRSDASTPTDMTVHMTTLLSKLVTSLRGSVASAHSVDHNAAHLYGQECVSRSLLDSASVLLSCASQYLSSAPQQFLVLVAVPETEQQVSFQSLATDHLFALVECSSHMFSNALQCSWLSLLLSLTLLQSNICAKQSGPVNKKDALLRNMEKKFVAHLQQFVEADEEQRGVLRVDVLLLLLRNIHIWLQFTQDQEGAVLSSILSSLFRTFVSMAWRTVQIEEEDGETCDKEAVARLVAVDALLRSAVVMDSRFIQEALSAAVTEEWAAVSAMPASSKAKSKLSASALTQRLRNISAFVLAVERSVPTEALLLPLLADIFSQLPELITSREKIGGAALKTIDSVSELVLSFVRRSGEAIGDSFIPPEFKILRRLASVTNCADMDSSFHAAVEFIGTVLSSGIVVEHDSPLCSLVCVVVDCWADYLVNSAAEEGHIDLLIGVVAKSLLVFTSSGRHHHHHHSITKSVFHTLISALMQAVTAARESSAETERILLCVFEPLKSLVGTLITQVQSALPDCEDAAAESVRVDDCLFSAAQALTLATVIARVAEQKYAEVFSAIATFHSTATPQLLALLLAKWQWRSHGSYTESTEGWLFLFGALTDHVLDGTGVVTVLLGDDEAAAVNAPVKVDLDALRLVCSLVVSAVQQQVEHQVAHRAHEWDHSPSAHIATAVMNILASLLTSVLGAGVCNSDAVEIFTVVNSSICGRLISLAQNIFAQHSNADDVSLRLSRRRRALLSAATTISKTSLLYFSKFSSRYNTLQYGSRSGPKYGEADKMSVLLDRMVRDTVGTFEALATAAPFMTGRADGEDLSSLLGHIQQVSDTLSSLSVESNHRSKTGRGGRGRQKQVVKSVTSLSDDSSANTLARYNIWCDGLLHLTGVLTSKLQNFAVPEVTPITSNTTAQELLVISVREKSHAELLAGLNEALLSVVRRLLLGIERVVSSSAHSSLSNLNTNVGNVVSLIFRHMHLLVCVEQSVSSSSAAAHSKHVKATPAQVRSVESQASKCHHLLARILTNVASSRDLEKHANLVAAVLVSQLAKERVSRSFQEVVFPGLYALFEKCRLRQKNQMFSLLDTQARAFMTDIHNEYVRTYKFVGK